MIFFIKKSQIELTFKPMSCFGYRLQWFFSVLYNNNSKTKLFYFTVFGLHFFYMRKKPAYKKMVEKAESVMFKVDQTNAFKFKFENN